jgi:hypothetical protein
VLKLRFVAINTTPNLSGVVRCQLSMAPAQPGRGRLIACPPATSGAVTNPPLSSILIKRVSLKALETPEISP